MYESGDKYLEIVRQEVQLLEKTKHCKVSHGEPGFCPRCHKTGTWDIASKGFNFGNSIYYSTVFNEWRCRACDTLLRPNSTD
jgi:hypothetical protein